MTKTQELIEILKNELKELVISDLISEEEKLRRIEAITEILKKAQKEL